MISSPHVHVARLAPAGTSAWLAAGLLALSLAQPAQAAWVIDPDNVPGVANGTDISTAFAGVTLSTLDNGRPNFPAQSVDHKVYAVDPTNGGRSCCAPPTGTYAFGLLRNTGNQNELHAGWTVDTLVAELTFLARTVAIDYSTDGVYELRAYGTGGLLASIDSDTDTDGTLNLDVGSNAITRIEVSLTSDLFPDAAQLDHLVFDADGSTVPEPATALLVLAAAGLMARRRR